jgi:CubicO group peptidase (beta-lactamase class C family)
VKIRFLPCFSSQAQPPMLKSLLAAVILTMGTASLAHAQIQPATESAIRSVLTGFVAADGPGCALGISQHGELLYSEGFGLANLEHNIPISPETIFDTGSVSKQFVAASIALLSLRGELDLNADVRTYLPELPEHEYPITVRQLVAHSGGFPDVYKLLEILGHEEDGNFYPSELTLEMIYRMKKLEFEPGTKFEYSNAGYLLLAQVVEKVSGQTLREFTQDNIFGPLGMEHTHFHDNYREIVPNRAFGYGLDSEGNWEVRNSNFYVVGDGGLYTTVGDLARWDGNFYANQLGGGTEFTDLILSPFKYSETGAEMRGQKVDYAFGLFLDTYQGEARVWHTGGWAGFAAAFMRFPQKGVSLVLLCNQKKPGLGDVLDSLLTTILEAGEFAGAGGHDE